ncbi:MAG: sulfatase [Planctomycetes bacterium]|nr:sulfatase [Planctomycetota bacterium]
MLPRLPLLLLGLVALAGCHEPTPKRPNVLLISLDSVRFDELTPYGGKALWAPDQPITPALQALSESGLTFDQAVSTTSWTLPSHMSLLTGLPDPVHGVTDNHKRLDPSVVTLAETLGAAGYRTAGFFSGPNLHPVFGFSQGFDLYENESANQPELAVFSDDRPGALLPVHRASHEDITSPRLVAAAKNFVTEAQADDAPFFCFVHFWDPHYDYVAPKQYEARFVRPGFDRATSGVTGTWEQDKLKRDWNQDSAADLLSLYHSELNFTDDYLGRLFAHLDELGIEEETLVVLIADHGEEFFDHGRWGHQRTLYDEVVRVPLILRWPGHLPAGQRVAGQARIQDLFATIADLADVPLPGYASEETLFGTSLRPLWEDPTNPGRDQLLFLEVPYRGIYQLGLRSAEPLDGEATAFKVLLDTPTQKAELFDLGRDPREQSPQALGDFPSSKNPKVQAALALEARIAAARKILGLTDGGPGADLTPEVRAELERLGYL